MEQNALSEALKGMSAISVAFKNFYPVVETFTGSIGFALVADITEYINADSSSAD